MLTCEYFHFVRKGKESLLTDFLRHFSGKFSTLGMEVKFKPKTIICNCWTNEENYAENLNINLGIFQLMIGEVLSQWRLRYLHYTLNWRLFNCFSPIIWKLPC